VQVEYEAAEERAELGTSRGATQSDLSRPDQLVEGYQLEHIVERAIAEMDADFREILVLRDIEDLSYEELSQITGLADGTVKSRLHRARAMLKAAVERKLGEKLERATQATKTADRAPRSSTHRASKRCATYCGARFPSPTRCPI
jgi:RNA polymerase sigma-70 factor (ECF subfamily)